MTDATSTNTIKAIDKTSVHRITSGQVVIDLQTAIKELVENSLDAGATSIEVKFKEYGVKSIEVVDNGSGISKENYEGLALKHHTSKLSSYEDLTTVRSFGFRGEALSSLCALSDNVVFVTATSEEAPMGTILEMERSGRLKHSNGRMARQRGTTVTVAGLFSPLPVRKKEFERNHKREFGKALNLLYAYALVPCAQENHGVRLVVSNQPDSGSKSVPFRTDGTPSIKSSISALWGPKQVENIVPFTLSFTVEEEKASLKRQGLDDASIEVRVTGMISKFITGSGRASNDRQFFYVNGRPCTLTKVQKAFNEVYKTFNPSQNPFIVADFHIPTTSCDINVSPDKRTIFIHSENNLIAGLKEALESTFSPSRSTYRISDLAHPKATKVSESTQIKASSSQETPGASPNPGGSPSLSSPFGPQPPVPSDGHSTELPGASSRAGYLEAEEPVSDQVTLHDAAPPQDINSHPRSAERALSPPLNSLPPAFAHQDVRPLFKAETPPLEEFPPQSQSGKRERSALTSNSTAEFTHVVSPVGTKRTYTTSSAERALVTATPDAPRRPVQTILSTSGASWNPRSADDDDDDGARAPKKKARVSAAAAVLDIRSRLTSFARSGSVISSQPAMTVGNQADDDVDMEDAEAEEIPSPDITKVNAQLGGNREPRPFDISRHSNPTPTAAPGLGPRSASPEQLIDVDVSEDAAGSDEAEQGPLSSPLKLGDQQTLHVKLTRLTSLWGLPSSSGVSDTAGPVLKVRGAASLANADDQKQAEEELARVISKEDFTTMEVMGQFNKGFIVARRHVDGSVSGSLPADDLFLVDQHAADEKFNFEDLQLTTKIQSQQLFRPRLLELSAADELIALENVDILRSNGFDIASLPVEAGERERVHLVAQPVSQSTVFDVKDLEELLHLMESAPTGQMVRCTKARNMFASRACRKSVMIGTALKKGQMTTIVRHMATMDQPWNCPHGRPTMRHLCQLRDSGDRRRALDWAAMKGSQ